MRAPDHDLGSQQNKLATVQYDLRITNLASFLLSKARNIITNQSPTLLDVGAGNGLFLKFFKSHGFSVRGYELEAELVANMKKDPELAGVQIEQGDITTLMGKEEFDVVIASDVIEHIKDDVKAIKGLYTFVKPGGMLLITVPGHSYLYGKRDVMWGHYRRYDQHVLLNHVNQAIGSMPYEIAFATQWNIVGFFVYGFFEKILHKPINETMRYSNSFPSKITRGILDTILKLEERLGGMPLGLTQVVGIRKK